MLLSKIFVFVIQQYNLMVCVDFFLIGFDPKDSHLLAGIAMSIADEGKGLGNHIVQMEIRLGNVQLYQNVLFIPKRMHAWQVEYKLNKVNTLPPAKQVANIFTISRTIPLRLLLSIFPQNTAPQCAFAKVSVRIIRGSIVFCYE